MTKYLAYLSFLLIIVVFGAGCLEEPPLQNAPIISKTQNIVSEEDALSATNEPVVISKASLPCLQFKFRDGFFNWLNSYEKEDPYTIEKSASLNLPAKPDPGFIEALRDSQVEGSLQTSICNIHKDLGVFSWAVEFPNETKIYTYRKPRYESLTVEMNAVTVLGDSYTSTTDLTQMGFPTCLPKKITNTELIWFCGTPFENWKQVHVNRNLGNMVQISCIRERDGEEVPVGAGCLVPTPIEQ
jgi:hypothetical protein